MSQDVVSDGLNQVMNAKRIEKGEVIIRRYSKVLVGILELMKKDGYIDYEIDESGARVKILKLNECRAVKPRYFTSVHGMDKYVRRFLPSRNFGILVLSTNKGLISHKDALKLNIGGSVVAFYY